MFLVDNIPAMEMFAPIIKYMGSSCECVFINFDGWTERNKKRIADYAQTLGVRCELLKRYDKKSVRDVLTSEKPDILIFSREETTLAQSLFLMFAKDMSIPTLLIPHGIISDVADRQIWGVGRKFALLFRLLLLVRQGFVKIKMGRKIILRLVLTGYYRIKNDFRNSLSQSRWDRYISIAAYGEVMRDILVRCGVDFDKIVITGNPKFDVIYSKKGSMVHRNVILLITDYMVEYMLWSAKQREDFVLSICQAVSCFPEYKLVIKIHPTMEGVKDYQFIVGELAFPPTIYQYEPIAELIGECTLAITLVSSAGLEAMAAGKPLVIFNPYNDVEIYKEEDGVYITRNKNELAKALMDVIYNGMSEQQRKLADDFVYRQAYLQDGKAAERIGNLINKMMEEKQTCSVVKGV